MKNPPKKSGTFIGAPGKIRTYDLLYRKQTLYPAELRVRITGITGVIIAQLSVKIKPTWRGGRVVEGARLEIVCAVKRIEGSNPSLSAKFTSQACPGF